MKALQQPDSPSNRSSFSDDVSVTFARKYLHQRILNESLSNLMLPTASRQGVLFPCDVPLPDIRKLQTPRRISTRSSRTPFKSQRFIPDSPSQISISDFSAMAETINQEKIQADRPTADAQLITSSHLKSLDVLEQLGSVPQLVASHDPSADEVLAAETEEERQSAHVVKEQLLPASTKETCIIS